MLIYTHLVLIAAIQGITEFLPISSSGHLVLLPNLTSLPDQGRTLDVAAHVGTMVAVTVYLRHDIQNMLADILNKTSSRSISSSRYLVGILIVASLPVIIVGLLVELLDPSFLRLTMTVAVANLLCAGWLYIADRKPVIQRLSVSECKINWHHLSPKDAFYIGCAQIIALIPGASRSGVTMTMARQLGYDRLSAARFSLLLSLPVIAGAGLVKGTTLATTPNMNLLTSAGIVAVLSFTFAFCAIRWMMSWLSRADFSVFVWYRIALGFILLGYIAFNG